ncbi:MAG: hypothetical protein IPH12_04390 [Saprospirales bacterium]|jgi:hypothetical protein|nr:hypothetical protein [Saprospirales bacterium]MBK8922485.1 hypothetical protein [Saprospirales bacterium]
MKYLLFSLALLPYTLFSQKHDYVWISGDSNTPNTTSHGGIIIDFNQQPLTAQYNYREMNMFVCNASICDSSGQLLAYTNGCHIAGANDEVLENGEMINPGLAWQVSCIQNADGYASGYQSAFFLARPDTQGIYYLFHKQVKLFLNPISVYSEALLISILDMHQNAGQGKVIEKNVALLRDTLAFGELLATKHANGKDWWVVTPRRNSNTFYVLKFTKDGIVDTLRQTIGIKP